VGSGVVLGYVCGYAEWIFGRGVVCAGGDVNGGAVGVGRETVERAGVERCWKREGKEADVIGDDGIEKLGGQAVFLDIVQASLLSAMRPGCVDVLLFNPPYVPTESLPSLPTTTATGADAQSKFEIESNLYALAYAGGNDGMEITNVLLSQLDEGLSERGVAYILFCASNKPDEVKRRLEEERWSVEVVAESGGKGGWERLCVMRIYRKKEGS
jgi:release factor glutamine methyltransferase